MFKFTICDVLWLMVVVALAVGWWVNRAELLRNRVELRRLTSEHEYCRAWARPKNLNSHG